MPNAIGTEAWELPISEPKAQVSHRPFRNRSFPKSIAVFLAIYRNLALLAALKRFPPCI